MQLSFLTPTHLLARIQRKYICRICCFGTSRRFQPDESMLLPTTWTFLFRASPTYTLKKEQEFQWWKLVHKREDSQHYSVGRISARPNLSYISYSITTYAIPSRTVESYKHRKTCWCNSCRQWGCSRDPGFEFEGSEGSVDHVSFTWDYDCVLTGKVPFLLEVTLIVCAMARVELQATSDDEDSHNLESNISRSLRLWSKRRKGRYALALVTRPSSSWEQRVRGCEDGCP
jgi:hypothetical protein